MNAIVKWIKGEPVVVSLIGIEITSLAALIPAGAPPAVSGAVAIVEALFGGLARQFVSPTASTPAVPAPAVPPTPAA